LNIFQSVILAGGQGKRLHPPAHGRVLAVLGVHRIGRKVTTRTRLSRRSAVIASKSLRIACFLDGRCLKDGGLLPWAPITSEPAMQLRMFE